MTVVRFVENGTEYCKLLIFTSQCSSSLFLVRFLYGSAVCTRVSAQLQVHMDLFSCTVDDGSYMMILLLDEAK